MHNSQTVKDLRVASQLSGGGSNPPEKTSVFKIKKKSPVVDSQPSLAISKTLPSHPSTTIETNSGKGERLRQSSNQFMQLADKLLGAMKSEEDEVQYAIGEARNYNLVSKSVKALPRAGNGVGGPRQQVKFGKLVGPDA